MKGWIIFFLVLFVALAIFFSLIVFQTQTYRTNLIVLENLKKASTIESIYKSMKAALHLSILKAWNNSENENDFKEKIEEYLNKYLLKLSEKANVEIDGLPIKVEKTENLPTINDIKNGNDEIYVETSTIKIKKYDIVKITKLNASIEKKYLMFKIVLKNTLQKINEEFEYICKSNLNKYLGEINCSDSCSAIYYQFVKSEKENEIKKGISMTKKLNSTKNTFVEINEKTINVNHIGFKEVEHWVRYQCGTKEDGTPIYCSYCAYKECYVSSIDFNVDLEITTSTRGTFITFFNTKNFNKNYSC